MSREPATLLTFGRCRLDLSTRELTVDGELIDLQPLVFNLLAYFAQHPKRVIGKEELLSTVWRSPFVTNSVVSRAVMKARRAVMDDARAPQVLVTVARMGYRFDSAVAIQESTVNRLPSPPHQDDSLRADLDLLVLPAQPGAKASGRLDLDLACLMFHCLERAALPSLLPMADILANWDHLKDAADPVAASCSLFGVREAIWFEFHRVGPDTWDLLVLRGRHCSEAEALRLQGPEVYALAVQAMASQPEASHTDLGLQQSPAALSDLARALALAQTREVPAALALLLARQADLAPSPWLQLLMAQLHLQEGQAQKGLLIAQKALAQLTQAPGSQVVRARLLGVQAHCQEHLDEPALACSSFQQALSLSVHTPALALQRADWLSLWAIAASRLNQPREAIRLGERAVLQAKSVGNLAAEARARLRSATALTLLQQGVRATEAVRLAVQVAQACRDPAIECMAVRALTLMLCANRHLHEAVTAAERGLALAQSVGAPVTASGCQVSLFMALMDSDQLVRAVDLADQVHSQGLTGAGHQLAFKGFEAMLSWKLDRAEEAIERLTRLTDRDSQTPNLPRQVYNAFLANALICLNQFEQATAVLQRLHDDPAAERRLYVQAHLAFAQGHRQACMDGLRHIWMTVRLLNEEIMDVAIDLAWLLMEDRGTSSEDEELDSLAAHVLDYANGYPAASLMSAAYLLRSAPSDLTRARWDKAIAEAITLTRRYPYMATQSFRDAFERGLAPRSPRLLTRMCT